MEAVSRCQTRRALFFFTVDSQAEREKKRVPRWIDKYMIHRGFGLNFKYREKVRKKKKEKKKKHHKIVSVSGVPRALSSVIENGVV